MRERKENETLKEKGWWSLFTYRLAVGVGIFIDDAFFCERFLCGYLIPGIFLHGNVCFPEEDLAGGSCWN